MTTGTLEHIQLYCNNLDQTRSFYRDQLNLNELQFMEDEQLSVFATGHHACAIQFQEQENVVDPDYGLAFLGLEFDSKGEIDAIFEDLQQYDAASIQQDMRDQFSRQEGPYGFFVKDPTGYLLKIYHYNEG